MIDPPEYRPIDECQISLIYTQPQINADNHRAWSSDVDVEQRDQDDAGDNNSYGDECQREAIGRRL